MATAGPNSPSSYGSIAVGGAAWSNSSNLGASDDSYATVSLTASNFSDFVIAKGFGFSIPAGATIDGIVVEIERKASAASEVTDNALNLTKDGANTASSDRADGSTFYPTSDTYKTYGSSSDLWGTTWTVAQINSANFGVCWACVNSNVATRTVSADHIRVTVYYTPSNTTTTQDINAKSRIQQSVSATIQGKSRVTATTTQTVQGKADIRNTTNQTIPGKGRVQRTVAPTLTALSRVQQSVDATIPGKGRVTTSVNQTVPGKAAIQRTTTATIPGRSRIQQSVNATINAKARLLRQYDYTYAALGSLPTDDANLSTHYDESQITDAHDENSSYVDATGTNTFLVHEFKDLMTGSETHLGRAWTGRVTMPASVSPVYLQIYNHNSDAWETVNSSSSAASPLTVSGQVNISITDYFDADNVTTWRVYQEVG